jgi:hypothetical protein
MVSRAAMTRKIVFRATLLISLLSSDLVLSAREPAPQVEMWSGPLRVSECNPRYFADAKGQVVYLTGSHTWTNFQDRSAEHPIPFDYNAYLDLLEKYHHNFIRLWTHESAAWMPTSMKRIRHEPLPYARPGPGIALDGLPKFDVSTFNQPYFDRLRDRVTAARDRGIYVAVMLFQGWSIEKKGHEKRNRLQRAIAKAYGILGVDPPAWDVNNPWNGHPFNGANNVNGFNGDLNRDGEGLEVHTLASSEITALQERYVRKVIDTVNDLPNVLYEISNESRGESTDWQYHMIGLIHDYEATKPQQHPVLMTWQWPGGSNQPLFESPADGISPGHVGDTGMAYLTGPPPADGSKVIIIDTDHLWGEGGDSQWIWKSFVRGHNPIFMDGLVSLSGHSRGDLPTAEEARIAMGQTLTYSQKIDLMKMLPRADLCSTGYCLVNPGKEYLAYAPEGGFLEIALENNERSFSVEWFSPRNGKTANARAVIGGSHRFIAPFEGDAVIYLKADKVTPRRADRTCAKR